MIYHLHDVLSKEQIEELKLKYNNLNFFDGTYSSNVVKEKKNNLIVSDGVMNNYASNILRSNETIINILCTKVISQTYFLWYKEGMHYDYHIDANPIAGVNAHYSMTCFLSDPEEYEGGELVIKVGNSETVHKLKAGSVVLYSTGLWHKVNKVTKGDRKVFVCWMESLIQNSFIRNHLIDQGFVINDMLKSNENQEYIERLEQLRINLMREYAIF